MRSQRAASPVGVSTPPPSGGNKVAPAPLPTVPAVDDKKSGKMQMKVLQQAADKEKAMNIRLNESVEAVVRADAVSP